jgi:diguanylate cyclase (GGDEF)-like protein
VLDGGEALDEPAGQPLGCGATGWARHRATAENGLVVVWFSRRGARPRADQPERDDDRMRSALVGAGHTLWEWSAEDGELQETRRFSPPLPDDELAPLVAPLDAASVTDAFTRHLSGETDEVAVEYRIGMEIGPWRWVADRGRVTERDADGAPLRALGTRADVTSRHRSEAELAALHRVSAEVAAGVPPRKLLGSIAQAAAEALDLEVGVVARREDAGWRVIGAFGDAAPKIGALLGTGGNGEPTLVGTVPIASWVDAPAGPMGGPAWGLVAAADRRREAIPPEAPRVLQGLAESMELALANARARAALISQATTDALTGLVNHRVFHERLGAEVARAKRHGDQISLVLIDLDHFKRVNDRYGHAAGDDVLRAVAETLGSHAREGDTVGRVGGEELAWLLPRADVTSALAAAERLREAVAAASIAPVGKVTASMGVCDLASANDAESLYERTDLALYWAKSSGRNRCATYSEEVAQSLLSQRSEAAATQSPHLQAVRTMAWTVDARDVFTHGRSERIAELATLLANELGWAPEQVELLREAALVHDVGMVAVPDEVLTQAGPLSADERILMQTHPSVGSRILADVLTAEQVRWIRHHHERHDGSGYPDGLEGEKIPSGSRLIGLADTWDAMTSGRLHKRRQSHDDAVAELRAAKAQFNPRSVAALESLFRRGALPGAPAIGDDTRTTGYLAG